MRYGVIFLCLTIQAQQATITGSFRYPDATLPNGPLTIALAAAAPQNTCSTPIKPISFAPRTVRIVSGVMPSLLLYTTSCLKPANPYNVTISDTQFNVLAKTTWTVPAADANITRADSGSAIPLAAGATAVTVSTASAGITQVVAGQANKKVRIYSAFFLVSQTYAPANFKLISATGCVNNQVDLIIPQRPGIPNVGQSYVQYNYQNPLTAAPGDDVCLNLSAAPISAQVQVLYTVQ